jgi:hypothetical protein
MMIYALVVFFFCMDIYASTQSKCLLHLRGAPLPPRRTSLVLPVVLPRASLESGNPECYVRPHNLIKSNGEPRNAQA